jgi:methylase of polypeptide subunit release factors
MSVQGFNAALGLIDTRLSDYPRILEWGCGCGRILLHMKDLANQVELYGVDIDAEAIEWADHNIPWVTA